ncbi:MAG TPA: hypothetical protein PKA05_09750 [Roseiflexaceae bacterium]|nr:hypothetical protein [Roseiflexaceae bacterium]HMP40650.1 hypothetical protein [Roseiflexaceae bacterium]
MLQRIIMLGLLVLSTACSTTDAVPQAIQPTVTIGAPIMTPTMMLAQEAVASATPTLINIPTRMPPRIDAGGVADQPGDGLFEYLWPEFLPEGMQLSSGETRVAQEGEIGAGEIGFFVLTFQDGGRKLVVGGGATDAIPLSGRIESLMIGNRPARRVSGDIGEMIVFERVQGTLFVFGIGMTRDELEQVAASLTPIDIRELREKVVP